MKLNNSFFYTLRENVKDEESVSGNLLVRSGMVKKVGSGIYAYLPLGLKVARNIESIIREEMDNAGAQELVMPSILPESVYVESGRKEAFGSDMFSLKDRYNRDYVLGPTHEELFVAAAKEKIKSYKDMPFNLYQMANKYRDEPRPRYGLIRVREFVMKDAYSFDVNNQELDVSYQKMYQAYQNIFERLNINYKIVTASTGAMGGLLSEEFQAVTDIGEDTLVLCSNCDFASNIEVCSAYYEESNNKETLKEKELIYTPNAKTIEDLINNYHFSYDKMIKTMLYKIDDKFYACLVKSNRDINEHKVIKLLNAKSMELASFEDVERITKAKVGFAGPINLNIPIIMDEEIDNMTNFIVGANKNDYHFENANLRDFNYDYKADIKNVIENDLCPKCQHQLIFKKGIEIGNTFKLGTKYSESLGLNYLDKENNLHPVVMGSYGIGIGRVISAIVEQNNDDKGIIWPITIAPYKVAIVLANTSEESVKLADNLYKELNKKHIDVILDDRDVRAGVKFNDMDLIGIPIRITIGKKASEGIVELKMRQDISFTELDINDVVRQIEQKL